MFGLPFATEQDYLCPEKEQEGDRDEVDEVTGVNNAFADGEIMMLDAKRFDDTSCISENFKGIDELKSKMDEEAEDGAEKEGDNLAVGDGGGENADRDEDDAEQEQSEVGSESASEVNVPDRVAQLPYGIDIDEGGQQRNEQQ